MQQLAKILKDMQLAGNPHQTDLLYGVVESVDPLSISVDARFTITSDFVELGNMVKDLSTNPPTLLLEVGQTIRLIRYSQGQKYLALEIVDVASGGGNYVSLSNKPILNTTHTQALVTQAKEVLKGVIELHRIAKTGSYEDLNNKPTIPTSLDQLTEDDDHQTVSVDEKLKWSTETHILDTRTTDRPPSWYLANYPQSSLMELKNSSVIGLNNYATGAMMVVQTIVPLDHLDTDYEVKQIAWGNNNETYYRTSMDHSTWIPWTALNKGGFFPPI